MIRRAWAASSNAATNVGADPIVLLVGWTGGSTAATAIVINVVVGAAISWCGRRVSSSGNWHLRLRHPQQHRGPPAGSLAPDVTHGVVQQTQRPWHHDAARQEGGGGW